MYDLSMYDPNIIIAAGVFLAFLWIPFLILLAKKIFLQITGKTPQSESYKSYLNNLITNHVRLGQLLTVLASWICYVLACVSPALSFFTSGGGRIDSGFALLLIGWLGIFYYQFAWFANPIFFLSWLFFFSRRWLATLICVVIAMGVALNTLFLFDLTIPADDVNSPLHSFHLTAINAGFYFGIASMLIFAIGTGIVWRISSTRKGDDNHPIGIV